MPDELGHEEHKEHEHSRQLLFSATAKARPTAPSVSEEPSRPGLVSRLSEWLNAFTIIRRKIAFLFIFLSLCSSLLLLCVIDRGLYYHQQLRILLDASHRNGGNPPAAVHDHSQTVLFVGDSIIASYPLTTLLPQQYRLVNRGVSGDSSTGIAERYQRYVTDLPHDSVVIEGGINDIMGCVMSNRDCEVTLQKVHANVEAMFTQVQISGTPAFYVSILPVTQKFFLPFSQLLPLPTNFDVKRVNALVRESNARMQHLCERYAVTYVDVFSVVLDQGELNRAYAAPDGYHINVVGYAAISAVLRSAVFTQIHNELGAE